MNYELAKKLKDSGFPQEIKRGNILPYGNGGVGFEEYPDYHVYEPTLSELIEACGDKISHLKRLENGRWFAVSHNAFYKDGVNNIEEDGETPDEAVANLWLELNKQDK